MADANRSFLLVPAAGAGEGMGHLARSIRLAAALGSRVSILTTRMDSAARALLAEELRHFPRHPRPVVVETLPLPSRWDILLVDARRTTRGELAALMSHGLVVCLDEGGEARRYAPFLVDAIPGLPRTCPANLSSAAFLDLPGRRKKRVRLPPRRALLSFGGEDREKLTGRLVEALLEEDLFAPGDLTIVEGPLFKPGSWPPGVAVVKGAPGLARGLEENDLLFSHYGITVFEALAAGVPVVTFNPTSYHERLAAAGGIPSIGTLRPDMQALRRLLVDAPRLRALVEGFNSGIGRDRGRRMRALLVSLRARGAAACPFCGRQENPVTARFSERTYRKCPRCSITYMQSFSPEPKRYGREYFSSEYKHQYGRTYLEDFEAIKAASRPRVRIVKELLRGNGEGVVVDVGCAYGPFLDAAREAGLPCYGVDVSPEAVDHVRRKLRIPALCSSFEKLEPRALPRRIAAITLWYVLEHFTDPDLTFRKASTLLPSGGVFAFSTPNGRGISARRSLQEFLRHSPVDHFTIFSPRGLRRLLEAYGLDLRRIRVTGHHPERFPGLLGKAAARSPGVYRLLRGVSRLLRLGDTFEAYAVKGK
jgi:2-polyprenyl-3-methyl-5-hydroxy-6-metoxy-1,4-benzoquinol methylase